MKAIKVGILIVLLLTLYSESTPAGMVLIPAGSFQMGNNFSEGDPDERPVHTVTVSAFYLDKYEVTKALWDEVYTWATENGYSFDNAGSGTAANHPVHTVSWYDVVKWLNARSEREGRTPVYYTNATQSVVYRTGQEAVVAGAVKWSTNGYRLPTEGEWEYAARAGTTTRFYTGNCISTDQANYDGRQPWTGCPAGQYRGSTIPVGSFAANPWGLYDMAGNVWEWTSDWYGAYPSGAAMNPSGPASGSIRVFRGGSWNHDAYGLRSVDRYGPPIPGDLTIGFRAALSQVTSATLTVTKDGNGNITSDSGAITWSGNTGTAAYISGTSVTLTATADSGAAFAGWSGACTGTGTCQVTMVADKSLTAIFTLADVSLPTVTAFTLPATATAATVSIATFAAADNVGVANWCIVETNNATGCAWGNTKPISYTFNNIPQGIATVKTLYAFAKDAAGNVSASSSSSTTITLLETTSSLQGDVDNNGKIDLQDVLIALQLFVGANVTLPVYKSADVNGDGKIGMAEVIYVLQCLTRFRNNRSPVMTAIGNKIFYEGVLLTFKISATDSDGDTPIYSATNLPSGSQLDAKSGTFTWTPTFAQSGTYQVTFVADDGYGGKDSQTVTISVVNVNRAPTFNTIGNKSVDENMTLSFTISATDPDGDGLTYSAASLPDGATFSTNAKTFIWTPTYSQSGTHQVTFTAADGYGGNASETITIVVNNITRIPVLRPIGNKTVDEGSNIVFTVSSTTDADGDVLTYSAAPLPNGATFNSVIRTFTWLPTYAQSGTYQVTFTVSDGYGGTDTETITITVMDKVPVFIASEYFPINVGDWKDYYLNTVGNVRRSSVTGTKIIGGVTTKITSDWEGDRSYYTSDQNGVKLYGGYVAKSAWEIILNPPILFIPNNAQIGTTNVSTSQYSFIYSGNTYHVNVTSTVIILGLEDVQTEHTLLRDCVKVSMKTDQYIVETEENLPGDTNYSWFYKGVGTVKRVDGSDTYTITSSSINGVIHNYANVTPAATVESTTITLQNVNPAVGAIMSTSLQALGTPETAALASATNLLGTSGRSALAETASSLSAMGFQSLATLTTVLDMTAVSGLAAASTSEALGSSQGGIAPTAAFSTPLTTADFSAVVSAMNTDGVQPLAARDSLTVAQKNLYDYMAGLRANAQKNTALKNGFNGLYNTLNAVKADQTKVNALTNFVDATKTLTNLNAANNFLAHVTSNTNTFNAVKDLFTKTNTTTEIKAIQDLFASAKDDTVALTNLNASLQTIAVGTPQQIAENQATALQILLAAKYPGSTIIVTAVHQGGGVWTVVVQIN